jgi:hypothetical protein
MTPLAPTTQVCAELDVMSCTFGDGLALLDLRCGTYFSLNAVGAYVWEQIAKPVTVSDLRAAVMGRYDVSDERCDGDLQMLLCRMTEANLVKASSVVPA